MPTSTFGFTKAPVSHHKADDEPGKLRRLASVTNIAKAFTRRQSSSNKENIPPPRTFTYQGENVLTSRSMLSAMPPPSLLTSRPRRVSSPHPRKEILPRSITTSNLPVPRPRLPSTSTSVSLIGRTLTSSPAPATTAKRPVPATSQASDKRRSLIPTPTSRAVSGNSARSFNSDLVGPKLRDNPVDVSRTPDLSPSKPGTTPQKIKHRSSKSPERKELRDLQNECM